MQATTSLRSGQTTLGSLASSFLSPIQEKQKAKRKKWIPDFARFKLKCYYKDGNASVHYSYDIYHKYENKIKQTITDEGEGLNKLITYINSVQHKIKTAVIWVTFEKEKGVKEAMYNYEVWKLCNRSGSPEPEITKSSRIYFADGKLNTDILKLEQQQKNERSHNE